jgi:hypothetical protein
LEIEAARRAGKLPNKITLRKRATIEDLLDDWSKSAEFKALSAASQSSYRKCISAILYRPQTREAAAKMRAEIRAAMLLGVAEPARELEAIATATPSSIGKPELRAFYNYAKSVRGHHMALAMIATLSAAFTWGQESILWRLGPNPREGMEFDHPDGRIVLVTMPEFSHSNCGFSLRRYRPNSSSTRTMASLMTRAPIDIGCRPLALSPSSAFLHAITCARRSFALSDWPPN